MYFRRYRFKVILSL